MRALCVWALSVVVIAVALVATFKCTRVRRRRRRVVKPSASRDGRPAPVFRRGGTLFLGIMWRPAGEHSAIFPTARLVSASETTNPLPSECRAPSAARLHPTGNDCARWVLFIARNFLFGRPTCSHRRLSTLNSGPLKREISLRFLPDEASGARLPGPTLKCLPCKLLSLYPSRNWQRSSHFWPTNRLCARESRSVQLEPVSAITSCDRLLLPLLYGSLLIW